MNESFLKFKKKIQLQTIVKSLLVGLAAALFAAGVILLVCKLTATENAYLYMLIGFVLLPIVFFGMYWTLRPDDAKVAQTLDRELALQEKTRTMVAFREQEGTVVALQREDVQERLDATPLNRLRFRRLWAFVLAPVLAAVLFVTAILVPAQTAITPPEPDDPYVFDPYDRGLLEMLIKEIREDEQLLASPKEAYVAELESLLNKMETVHYESEKERAVLATIEAEYAIAKSENTADELAAVLKESQNEGVVALGELLEALDYSEIRNGAVQNAMDEVNKTIDWVNGAAVSDLESLHEQFGKMLERAELDHTDPLYQALVDLSAQLYASRTAGESEAVQELFNDAVRNESVTGALATQAYTYNRAQYIEQRLRAIFGMETGTPDDKPNNPSNPNNPTDAPPPEEVTDGPGGIGGDDMDYGSNEKFFDPELGYVSYGVVIDEYNNYVRAMKEEGKIPEDLEEFILKYFGILSGGVDVDDAESENK